MNVARGERRPWNAAKAVLAASAVVMLAAGCVPGRPDPLPSQLVAVTQSPEAPSAPEETSEPGVLDTRAIQAAWASFPADAPFEWTGGKSVSYPARDAFSGVEYPSTPAECADIYNSLFLYLADDVDVAPGDKIMQGMLTDLQGAGFDDDVTLATVAVRILEDPENGQANMVDLIDKAADACASGFEVDSAQLGWVMLDVSSMERLDPAPAMPEGVNVIELAAHADDIDHGASIEVWCWAAFGNVVVGMTYYVIPDVPEGSVGDAQEKFAGVVQALVDAGS